MAFYPSRPSRPLHDLLLLLAPVAGLQCDISTVSRISTVEHPGLFSRIPPSPRLPNPGLTKPSTAFSILLSFNSPRHQLGERGIPVTIPLSVRFSSVGLFAPDSPVLNISGLALHSRICSLYSNLGEDVERFLRHHDVALCEDRCLGQWTSILSGRANWHQIRFDCFANLSRRMQGRIQFVVNKKKTTDPSVLRVDLGHGSVFLGSVFLLLDDTDFASFGSLPPPHSIPNVVQLMSFIEMKHNFTEKTVSLSRTHALHLGLQQTVQSVVITNQRMRCFTESVFTLRTNILSDVERLMRRRKLHDGGGGGLLSTSSTITALLKLCPGYDENVLWYLEKIRFAKPLILQITSEEETPEWFLRDCRLLSDLYRYPRGFGRPVILGHNSIPYSLSIAIERLQECFAKKKMRRLKRVRRMKCFLTAINILFHHTKSGLSSTPFPRNMEILPRLMLNIVVFNVRLDPLWSETQLVLDNYQHHIVNAIGFSRETESEIRHVKQFLEEFFVPFLEIDGVDALDEILIRKQKSAINQFAECKEDPNYEKRFKFEALVADSFYKCVKSLRSWQKVSKLVEVFLARHEDHILLDIASTSAQGGDTRQSWAMVLTQFLSLLPATFANIARRGMAVTFQSVVSASARFVAKLRVYSTHIVLNHSFTVPLILFWIQMLSREHFRSDLIAWSYLALARLLRREDLNSAFPLEEIFDNEELTFLPPHPSIDPIRCFRLFHSLLQFLAALIEACVFSPLCHRIWSSVILPSFDWSDALVELLKDVLTDEMLQQKYSPLVDCDYDSDNGKVFHCLKTMQFLITTRCFYLTATNPQLSFFRLNDAGLDQKTMKSLKVFLRGLEKVIAEDS